MIKLIDMGNRMTKMNSSDRSLRVEDCVFCGIIRGEGTRKIYEVITIEQNEDHVILQDFQAWGNEPCAPNISLQRIPFLLAAIYCAAN